jgi:hypothetical protein
MALFSQRNAEGMPPATPFIEFVMMQAQNILFMLGLLTTPDGRRARPDIEGARILIDQLGMIKDKTRGNLTEDESTVLNDVLSRVRLTFVEVARSLGEDPQMDLPTREELEGASHKQNTTSAATGAQRTSADKSSGSTVPSPSPQPAAPEESKKRFVKSFG